MSLRVGVVFLTTLATYIYAFRCTAEFLTYEWCIAAAIGLGPTLFSVGIGQSVLREDWPCTPVSLFMWNGRQAQALLQLLMTGDTNIVFATRNIASGIGIVGMRVLYHGEMPVSGEEKVVHDCVLRSIGFTMVQGGPSMIRAAQALQPGQTSGLAVKAFLRQIQFWLMSERRLFEGRSGELLTHAYLVRIDDKHRVTKILMQN
eukprot:CAMPEP_0195519210 /NCGR_PEP_ID=MMETSP0794_2-20130614/14517_1 /TAXON_ID=515487 /ORGANISM="Stephanopyxis turris, Strain CCMP 815" /LENGTH=202 /DNA_ID=CAMNT_0040648331 /DNA_START=780 /DNA_END=1385 /DNA_ORIENTATION=-